MKPVSILLIVSAAILVGSVTSASAQQYKLKQASNLMGMKTESTVYVKGMRKRTESGGMMGMPAPPVTIEQCDLQRTIHINDKKKLYFIEPFAKDNEEVIEEDVKPVTKPQPVTSTPKTGGVITTWYSITDTGERKKMYGFTARHVWTSQKMKPSDDACSMKDSMLIKTDGWYIDLPQFSCPVRRPVTTSNPNTKMKPDCKDRFVTRRSGKGKLGFPLIETTTILMGNGFSKSNEVKTDLETIELSVMKLDSMLFEIPPGYTETKNQEELQDKFNIGAMINDAKEKYGDKQATVGTEEKKAGVIRIGVYVPKADEQVQPSVLQQHIVSTLNTEKTEAIAVATEEEARKYKCDLVLTSEFVKMKQASKVGGLLKAIKNSDPSAASSFNIEANMILANLADGAVRSQQNVDGKYEGKADDAAMKALDKGCGQLLKAIK